MPHRHTQPDYPRHNRRWARICTALVVGITAAIVCAVYVSNASAYVHVGPCKTVLRDDIHRYGKKHGYISFVGWSQHVTRYGPNSIRVKALLTYRGGWHWINGHCWRRDYGPHRFG